MIKFLFIVICYSLMLTALGMVIIKSIFVVWDHGISVRKLLRLTLRDFRNKLVTYRSKYINLFK